MFGGGCRDFKFGSFVNLGQRARRFENGIYRGEWKPGRSTAEGKIAHLPRSRKTMRQLQEQMVKRVEEREEATEDVEVERQSEGGDGGGCQLCHRSGQWGI